MALPKYQIATANRIGDIEDKINTLHNQGYKIKGSLKIKRYGYFQLMKLRKKP